MEGLVKEWSTAAMVRFKRNSGGMDGTGVALLVGGPDGLDPRCTSSAQISLVHLSTSDVAAPRLRVIFSARQIYRAWTLNE